MTASEAQDNATSKNPWTLKKAVTTLAIAPQTESLTRAGRMAYNVMIFLSQRMQADIDGGYSAPLSQIVKGFGASTRDSTRIRQYMEQMCTTVVRWFPLSADDDRQRTLDGVDTPLTDMTGEGRIFTLLSEVRFTRKASELWVTWFFPPTIREILIEPVRWAQLDIKELSSLSHYASVALYEICARYKAVPGGLTNRAEPAFWVQTLRPDPETKPREWRKFKNETLKPAVTEITQRTSLDVQMIEYKQGRVVASVQFSVRRKDFERVPEPVDLTLVEQASRLGIRERDLDQLSDEFGEERIGNGLAAVQARQRAQPSIPINSPAAYLRTVLRKEARVPGASDAPESEQPAAESAAGAGAPVACSEDWLAQRRSEINEAMDQLDPLEFEKYVELARASMRNGGLLTPAMQKRFENRQYRSPLVWEHIRTAYALERFGRDWKTRQEQAV